ncbi:MAG: ribbon-helix-helix protein, CopG family [Thermoanaerobaculia bacterium]
MDVQVSLPEELVAEIDEMTEHRGQFVEEAVRRLLREARLPREDEVARINELADELNREAEDVLEYQVIP